MILQYITILYTIGATASCEPLELGDPWDDGLRQFGTQPALDAARWFGLALEAGIRRQAPCEFLCALSANTGC